MTDHMHGPRNRSSHVTTLSSRTSRYRVEKVMLISSALLPRYFPKMTA